MHCRLGDEEVGASTVSSSLEDSSSDEEFREASESSNSIPPEDELVSWGFVNQPPLDGDESELSDSVANFGFVSVTFKFSRYSLFLLKQT